MTDSLAPFWWLLALIGAFVLLFAFGLWAKLSRRRDQDRTAEEVSRDLQAPRDGD